ncbi:MAG: hypothetical protein LBQ39_08585 [Tannerellaceae bacterium]|nr:hypothetical protein [Tannerellaceae bacterium]
MALCLPALTAYTQKSGKLLLSGSGWNKIVIADKTTKAIEWEYPLLKGWDCNSVAATPDGNILFSYSKGAKLISRDKKEIWDIAVPEGCEMHTARVLSDGNYLLAWCGIPATILEVNPQGEILSKTEVDTRIETPHAQFRQIDKNSRGNYLIPLFATSEIHEIAPSGQVVNRTKVAGNPFCIAPLDNGNYLVACGDAHSYMEIDLKTGEVVRTVGANDIEGISLSFVAQLLPVCHGGVYICNWQGHDEATVSGGNPQVIEVDGNGEIVWSLNDHVAFGLISAICPIDE